MKDKTKLIISLLKLVRPFLMIMLLAIILGVLGHLTATFITVFIILAFFLVVPRRCKTLIYLTLTRRIP